MKKSKPKIRMIVVEDEEGFSAFATVDGKFIATMAKTFDAFLENLVEAVNFSFEEDGLHYSLNEISLVSSKETGVSLLDAYREFSDSNT